MAPATSNVVTGDVCFREAANLISTTYIGRIAVVYYPLEFGP